MKSTFDPKCQDLQTHCLDIQTMNKVGSQSYHKQQVPDQKGWQKTTLFEMFSDLDLWSSKVMFVIYNTRYLDTKSMQFHPDPNI